MPWLCLQDKARSWSREPENPTFGCSCRVDSCSNETGHSCSLLSFLAHQLLFFFILILSRVPYCFSLIQRLDSSVFLADCNNLSFSLVSVSRSLYLFTEIGGKHLRELILVFHTGVGNQTQDVWLGIGFYKWNTVFLVTLLKTIVLYIHVFLFPTHIHRFLILHLSQQPFLALSPVQEGKVQGARALASRCGASFWLWAQ